MANTNQVNENSKIVFPSSYSRMNGQPLDDTLVWYPAYVDTADANWKVVASTTTGAALKTGLERAQHYATTEMAYVGQVLTVMTNSGTEETPSYSSKVYVINDAAGNLVEVSGKSFNTIVVSGQTAVEADIVADTLTLEGNGINIATDADNDKITFSAVYSNSTPIVNGIGSIKSGDTFSNKTIQEMLTMILYPYIDIEVGTSATASPNTGTYNITPSATNKGLPTLQSVVLNVTKNSATNLSFELWDTTTNTKVAGPLTEENLSSNKLTFSNLNYAIDTTRTFAITYSYQKDDGTRVPASGTRSVTVGTFTITFTDPVIPTPTTNLVKNSWYAGQTASVTAVTVSAPTLNSAEKITKLELYKDGSQVGDAVTNPTFPYTFNRTDNLTSTSTSTVNNTYKVKAYFEKRSGTSTTEIDGEVFSSNLTITFTYAPATISLSGVTGGNFSKLNPQSISSNTITANFTKYSDSITSVKLLESGSVKEEQTVSGYSGTAYSDTPGAITFDYSKTNTCTNFELKAQVFNSTTAGAFSNEISYNFYAPYCCGWVNDTEDNNFSSVTVDTLKQLSNTITLFSNNEFEDSSKGIKIIKDGNTVTAQLRAPESSKKFIFAIPNGNFTVAKNNNTNMDDFGQFENSADVSKTKKTIIFADQSDVTYQILILANGTKGAIDYSFS